MSAKYRPAVPVFNFWPKRTHPAALSLCDSWAICQLSRSIDQIIAFERGCLSL